MDVPSPTRVGSALSEQEYRRAFAPAIAARSGDTIVRGIDDLPPETWSRLTDDARIALAECSRALNAAAGERSAVGFDQACLYFRRTTETSVSAKRTLRRYERLLALLPEEDTDAALRAAGKAQLDEIALSHVTRAVGALAEMPTARFAWPRLLEIAGSASEDVAPAFLRLLADEEPPRAAPLRAGPSAPDFVLPPVDPRIRPAFYALLAVDPPQERRADLRCAAAALPQNAGLPTLEHLALTAQSAAESMALHDDAIARPDGGGARILLNLYRRHESRCSPDQRAARESEIRAAAGAIPAGGGASVLTDLYLLLAPEARAPLYRVARDAARIASPRRGRHALLRLTNRAVSGVSREEAIGDRLFVMRQYRETPELERPQRFFEAAQLCVRPDDRFAFLEIALSEAHPLPGPAKATLIRDVAEVAPKTLRPEALRGRARDLAQTLPESLQTAPLRMLARDATSKSERAAVRRSAASLSATAAAEICAALPKRGLLSRIFSE